MERIASFQVDHRKIDVGMYISRVDGDIVTYDIRMVKPNGGVYLETPSMHTYGLSDRFLSADKGNES